MLRDYVLELVSAPGTSATVTLPGVAPTGRIGWAAGFGTSQSVFYVLDDSLMQEWGVGVLTVGSPSTITRPTVVLGNSAGTTARLNFTDTCRCYTGLPAKVAVQNLAGGIARNLLHNSMDRVQQRGAGAWTSAGFISDRWQFITGTGGGSRSVSITALGDTSRGLIGDEEALYAVSYAVTGGTAAGDLDCLVQNIEGVRRTAGKTVTVSFWAVASGGTPKIGINLVQTFGSGGSPSAQVVATAQAVTLSTTFTRYTATFTLASVNGKSFGSTTGTDTLAVQFWLSSGSTFNSQAGSIGPQTTTFTIFGRQLEIGAVATPLEKVDIRYDTANCMRFYQSFFYQATCWAASAASFTAPFLTYPLPMRAAPTISQSGNAYVGASAISFTPYSSGATVVLTCTGTGSSWGTSTLALSADI